MSLVRSQFFQSPSRTTPRRLACLVTGFTGKISQYAKAIDALQAEGYDVVAFEYNNTVLDAGDPQLLLNLVDDITARIRAHSANYPEVMCTGVSLGAYLAINVQRRLPQVGLGVYATAGVPLSHVIFTSRVFYKVKRAFVANGYNEARLRTIWQQTDENVIAGLQPNQSMVVVLGKLDRILAHHKAVELLEGWKRQGIRVEYFSLRTLGHGLTIRWYKNHLGDLLKRARALQP